MTPRRRPRRPRMPADLIRSSVVPQTIASDTAQNTNWKSHFASIVASEQPRSLEAASCGSPYDLKQEPMSRGHPRYRAGAAEREREAHRPVAIDAIEKLISIFATPRLRSYAREADLEQHESGLHEQHQHGGDQHPHGVDRTVSDSFSPTAASSESAEAIPGTARAASRPSGIPTPRARRFIRCYLLFGARRRTWISVISMIGFGGGWVFRPCRRFGCGVLSHRSKDAGDRRVLPGFSSGRPILDSLALARTGSTVTPPRLAPMCSCRLPVGCAL